MTIKDPIILIVPRDVRLHQIAEFAANVGCSLRLGDTGQIRLVKNNDAKAGGERPGGERPGGER